MTHPAARYRFLAPRPALRPLGAIWGWLMELRRRAYGKGLLPSRRVARPVLSVGNLTLGGNGKTPMCVFLAQALERRGLRTAILSRGYGRRPRRGHPEPLVVSLGQGPLLPVAESGDEPFLMAQRTRALIVLARRRALAADLAIGLGAEVLILDDGFQHLSLERDLDILMLQAGRDLADDFVIPAGFLRERAATLAKADLLVALGRDLPPALSRLAAGRPLFLARAAPSGLRALSSGLPVDPASLKGKRLAAFCGLARPGSFFGSLSEMGLRAGSHLCLPDHEGYGPKTIGRLGEFRALSQADFLLTTAKDAVKLPSGLPLPVLTLESDLVLERPEDFISETLRRLGHLTWLAGKDEPKDPH
ncbi:MAG: tetraacyldisaccharide 4'-kinase [Deltaproteobacteria bacterium]|nr:tetraacyldisaccharide 4'-kinase [Deltaproteobacteria bacterium]